MRQNIEIVTNERCTGCAGCYNACPEGAIEMILSNEGFYRPIVDRLRCTNCGLCIKKCPELSWKPPFLSPPRVYAAWSKDDSVRLSSSSGGIFSELARGILEAGGVVVACAWNKNWEPEHLLVQSWDEVEKFRGSKYVPSKIGKVIRTIREISEKGRDVLFCGTPCQVAALGLALSQKQREKVLLVDLICHGVPSLRAFQQYRDEFFPEGLKSYCFRGKSNNSSFNIRAVTQSERLYDGKFMKDPFVRAFLVDHVIMMDSCHDCRYQGSIRPGDITVGDFWRVPSQWSDWRGVSVILTNTLKGNEWIDLLRSKENIELRETGFDIAVPGNPRLLSGVVPKPFWRAVFMRQLSQGVPFMKLYRYYSPVLKLCWGVNFFLTRHGRRWVLSKLKKLVLKVFFKK